MSIPLLSGIGQAARSVAGTVVGAAGHAINAGNDLIDYGSLHAPSTTPVGGYMAGTGPNSLGVALVNAGNAIGNNATPADVSASGGGTGGGAASTGGGGSVLGTSTTNTANTGTGTGTSTGTGTTSGTNANGGNANFLNAMFLPALGNLQSAYTTLFGNGQPGQGQYGQAAGQAAGNVQQNYQSQQNQLSDSYAQAQNQMPWELVGRGAGSSSWADNNINNAQQQYGNSLQGLNAGETKDLGSIAQAENQAQGQYSGYLNAFNNPAFQAALNNSDEYYQNSQYGSLLQDLANAQGTEGAQTPLPTAVAQLQNNPSYVQSGSGNIASALQNLAGTPTTQAAQNQIAQGIVGNPTNPTSSIWSNYWQQLQQNPNTPAPTVGS